MRSVRVRLIDAGIDIFDDTDSEYSVRINLISRKEN